MNVFDKLRLMDPVTREKAIQIASYSLARMINPAHGITGNLANLAHGGILGVIRAKGVNKQTIKNLQRPVGIKEYFSNGMKQLGLGMTLGGLAGYASNSDPGEAGESAATTGGMFLGSYMLSDFLRNMLNKKAEANTSDSSNIVLDHGVDENIVNILANSYEDFPDKASFLRDKNVYTIYQGERPIGVVGLNPYKKQVNMAIIPSERGKGYGQIGLALLRQKHPEVNIGESRQYRNSFLKDIVPQGDTVNVIRAGR